MFGIGFQEMLIILVVILVIFGPKRLPDLARSLGKGIAEFKKASEEVRKGIEEAVQEEEKQAVPASEETAAAREAVPVPGEAAPAESAPVEAAPVEAAPVEAAPVEAAAAREGVPAPGDPVAGLVASKGPEAGPPKGA